MSLRILLATLHLLGLAVGIAAVYARGRALDRVRSKEDMAFVFHADNWYGFAAVVWISTGLFRAFGGLEKGSSYYLGSHWFLGKMGLFGIVLLLELLPMITLIRWRMARKEQMDLPLERTTLLARLSYAQVPLLVLMVFMAVAMARGM